MFNKMKWTAAMSVLAVSMVFTACNEQDAKKDSLEAAKAAKSAEVAASAPSKSVVVYFSQTGATKKLAEIFTKAKNADAVEQNPFQGSLRNQTSSTRYKYHYRDVAREDSKVISSTNTQKNHY